MGQQDGNERLRAGFEKTLERHGHPFQNAVIRRCQELFEARRSRWAFETSEFPVAVGAHETKVDFILRWGRAQRIEFVVAECKRVDPALADWCFIKTRYVRRNYRDTEVAVDSIRLVRPVVASGVQPVIGSKDIYHIGYEIKGADKGTGCNDDRGAIEKATKQVLLGLNGFIRFFTEPLNRSMLVGLSGVRLFPAIFTTARLWTSDVDLAQTNLVDGHPVFGGSSLAPAKWLWFQYHQSPSLTHNLQDQKPPENVGEALTQYYSRTIAVVSAAGVEEFLTGSHWETVE